MLLVGIEPTIQEFQLAKTVHDCVTTVIGGLGKFGGENYAGTQ
jgi:hypothetical protein